MVAAPTAQVAHLAVDVGELAAQETPLGPASLRKALDLPAVVAMRANPALRAFAERLGAAGKYPKGVVVTVMR